MICCTLECITHWRNIGEYVSAQFTASTTALNFTRALQAKVQHVQARKNKYKTQFDRAKKKFDKQRIQLKQTQKQREDLQSKMDALNISASTIFLSDSEEHKTDDDDDDVMAMDPPRSNWVKNKAAPQQAQDKQQKSGSENADVLMAHPMQGNAAKDIAVAQKQAKEMDAKQADAKQAKYADKAASKQQVLPKQAKKKKQVAPVSVHMKWWGFEAGTSQYSVPQDEQFELPFAYDTGLYECDEAEESITGYAKWLAKEVQAVFRQYIVAITPDKHGQTTAAGAQFWKQSDASSYTPVFAQQPLAKDSGRGGGGRGRGRGRGVSRGRGRGARTQGRGGANTSTQERQIQPIARLMTKLYQFTPGRRPSTRSYKLSQKGDGNPITPYVHPMSETLVGRARHLFRMPITSAMVLSLCPTTTELLDLPKLRTGGACGDLGIVITFGGAWNVGIASQAFANQEGYAAIAMDYIERMFVQPERACEAGEMMSCIIFGCNEEAFWTPPTNYLTTARMAMYDAQVVEKQKPSVKESRRNRKQGGNREARGNAEQGKVDSVPAQKEDQGQKSGMELMLMNLNGNMPK